ncbi:Tctex1 domain-containing protein 3 [Chytridiales sp. JEL 0842]|nr:Tctex1 domain-containing protein 3 [Chytridiales sp. JEL 0842]
MEGGLSAQPPAASLGPKGSRDNLRTSKNDLSTGGGLSSKAGSMRNLARDKNHPVQPAAVEQATNAPMYENTYRMKPEKKFQSEAVRKLADEILQRTLQKVKYDAEKVPELTMAIANEMLASVKKLEFDRYKIVVDVSIGEFKGQGIRSASRALWDTSTDSYASTSYRNATLFAVATVFGLYFE